MTKIVRTTHIIGERGVNAFADYCNRHKPYIIFREVTKNDFGIDAEVELTAVNEDGKIEPTGEILKVQIKSTEQDASYIRNEKSDRFSFYASQDDIEYWKKYRKYGLNVLLVIFDGRSENEKIYCKQIDDIDAALVSPKSKKKSIQPIDFNKTDHCLDISKSDFATTFSKSFRGRVNYIAQETLISNMWAFRQRPSILYTYPTHCKTKKSVFEKITDDQAPYFVIYNSVIYTFSPLEKDFQKFYEIIVSLGSKRFDYSFQEVVSNSNLRNHYIELLNEYIKDFMKRRSLNYQRDFNRYYFYLKSDQEIYSVPYRTRRAEKDTEKIVAQMYTYGKDTFFRHLAVEVKSMFVEERLYLIVTPKYYFSSDRKNAFDPKKTTKYTNFLNSKIWNDGIVDLLHFWWEHLSKNGDELMIFDGTTMNRPSISVGRYVTFQVPFGIPLDTKKEKKKKLITSTQLTLEL